MIATMAMVVILSVIFWVICNTISVLAGMLFITALMLLIWKLLKDILKK